MKAINLFILGILIIFISLAIYISITDNIWFGGVSIGIGVTLCGFAKAVNKLY